MADALINLDPIYRKCSWGYLFLIKDEETGDPFPLTGYTGEMKVVDTLTGDTILHLATATGEIEINESAGSIQLHLTEEDTEEIKRAECVYDLVLDNGSNVWAIFGGGVETRITVTYG